MHSLTLLAAALGSVPFALASPLLQSISITGANVPQPKPGKYWHGWKGVQKLFSFGDSYTTTGFNATMTQPSAGNPLGNPPYPGYTSSNGPNWVDFLTVKYNQSLVETYNLAYGGATVDSDLVAPYLPTVLSFKQQVNDEFVPYYSRNKTAGWTASNSLFAAFFGINDVGNSYYTQNATLNDAIFKVYSSLLDQLYHLGARNFLILNVPPVNLAPLSSSLDPASQALEAADLADFNDRLAAMAYNLKYNYADTTVFQFDTSRVFSQVLTYPASYPQTAGYKNTTEFCDAYENGTPAQDTFNETCGIPVNQYFWLNSLHPTYPMHDVLAEQVSLLLEK